MSIKSSVWSFSMSAKCTGEIHEDKTRLQHVAEFGIAVTGGLIFPTLALKTSSKVSKEEEEFYGFEDFFGDLQEEFNNWEASASKGKPKSLWEELAETGEEFVEFLEELNISDGKDDTDNNGWSRNRRASASSGTNKSEGRVKNEAGNKSSIEDNIDEIEATMAQLNKVLGLQQSKARIHVKDKCFYVIQNQRRLLHPYLEPSNVLIFRHG